MATPETISLVSEDLLVGTRPVITGRVRVETKTELVEEWARAELESSAVEVVVVPVNRPVDEVPDVRTVGDVTIIPVMEEVLVVSKRLVLKEELHVTRRISTETVETPVSLRKQHAVVSREPVTALDDTSPVAIHSVPSSR